MNHFDKLGNFLIYVIHSVLYFIYNFQVTGNRQVTLKDRDKLPYIVATVNEIQRLKIIGTCTYIFESLKINRVTA